MFLFFGGNSAEAYSEPGRTSKGGTFSENIFAKSFFLDGPGSEYALFSVPKNSFGAGGKRGKLK